MVLVGLLSRRNAQAKIRHTMPVLPRLASSYAAAHKNGDHEHAPADYYAFEVERPEDVYISLSVCHLTGWLSL